MQCLKCDEELRYDEVDIGVGLMRGNYRCDSCGWTDRDDITEEGGEVMNMETQIKEALARGYCSPENAHKVLDPILIEAMTQEILQSFTPSKTDRANSDV